MNTAKKIGFFSAFILPVLLITGYLLQDYWNYLTIVFVFLAIPLLDVLSGNDEHNVTDEEIKTRGNQFYYRFILYTWVWAQILLILGGTYAVSMGFVNTTIEWVGFVISMGLITGGVGITVAHELGHKKAAIERFYSKVLLMTVFYMHFYIEHNRGHHVHVATPQDPATAREGENFYKFWVRSVVGSYFSAWRIENTRLSGKGRRVLSIHNNMIWFTLLPIVFCAALMAVMSILTGGLRWEVPLFFISQSVVAFTLLELVNYIEHYGIVRREVSPGVYERVSPHHSWNANQLVSNFFLFQLQRHSDHHVHAIRRYQVLRHYPESPQLPASYPTMILVALLPPLWFRLMDGKLKDWKLRVAYH